MSYTVAVPDATTWTDTPGNTWTSHGADVTVHNPPPWEGVRFKLEIETSVADTYRDVTDDYVTAAWSAASRTRWGQKWSPGKASLTLKHGTAQYFGDDDSTYVRLGRKVRITAIHGVTEHVQFQGYVAAVTTPVRAKQPYVTTITCRTELARIARANRAAVTAVGSGDTETQRINRILDSVGQSSSLRSIEIGSSETTSPVTTTLEGSAIDELDLVAVSFLGNVLEDVTTGKIRYVNNSALSAITAAGPVMFLHSDTFSISDAPGAGNPSEWKWAIDALTVINYASTAEIGGTPTVYENASSQSAYGIANYIRADLICTSGLAPNIAWYQVAHFAEPLEQPSTAVLTEGDDAFVNAVLTAQLLDKVQIYLEDRWLHQPYVQLVGIDHTIRPGKPSTSPNGRTDLWTCVLHLDATEYVTVTPDP